MGGGGGRVSERERGEEERVSGEEERVGGGGGERVRERGGRNSE